MVCCFVVFQLESADLRIQIGHGKVNALMNRSSEDDSRRKFLVMGPRFLCGSLQQGEGSCFVTVVCQ